MFGAINGVEGRHWVQPSTNKPSRLQLDLLHICSVLHVLHERASYLCVLHLLCAVCAEIIVQASANKPSWKECSANKPCGRQGPYGTLGHGVINEANTC